MSDDRAGRRGHPRAVLALAGRKCTAWSETVARSSRARPSKTTDPDTVTDTSTAGALRAERVVQPCGQSNRPGMSENGDIVEKVRFPPRSHLSKPRKGNENFGSGIGLRLFIAVGFRRRAAPPRNNHACNATRSHRVRGRIRSHHRQDRRPTRAPERSDPK